MIIRLKSLGGLMRLALGIEYDGSQYHGWQSQRGLHTVQQCVESAIEAVADHEIKVTCAGRTDTGVHATNQVIHFDSDADRTSRAWLYGVNSNLPKDISVRWVKEVNENFHARFSATARRYQYVIFNHAIRPALLRCNITWHYRQLNDKVMHSAAQYLLGKNDFTSFRAVECQSNSPCRNVLKIAVYRQQDKVIIDITANAFLHHMVRNIAGVLMSVGSGKQKESWVKSVLDAKDRKLGAETAPPYGLYLVDVIYPDEFTIKTDPIGPLLLTE